MLRKTLLLTLVLAAAAPHAPAEEIRFARYPHAANDGRIAFTYHGDIWIAEAGGANPRRLTAHIASDRFPRFSPDGEWIAFTSDRMGNDDLWVIPARGGEPRQLTFNTTGDTMLYWTPDGSGIVFETSRGAAPWGSPLYIVPVEGGIPVAMKMDRGAAGMISHDGKHVAFNRIGFRYWRKQYRGNNNTDVYVQDLQSGNIRQLTDLDDQNYRNHTQDAYPMWGVDGMIYFMSERDGFFNIWRIAHDSDDGGPEQVTFHDDDGIQYPSISPDGRTIMYEADFQLWKLSVPDGEPQLVTISMQFDPKETLIEYLSSNNRADGFAPSPDGQRVAVDYHGEIFIVPCDPETGEKVQVTSSPWRDQNQVWSPDGRYIAYISDESHEEEIWFYDLEAQTKHKMTDQESIKSSLTWSPQSDRLLFQADNRLYLLDAREGGDGGVTEIVHNPEGGFSGPSFSNDGRWLVYSRSDENLNSEVYLFNIEQRQEHNVTDHLARDRGGELTHDGRHVVFVSDREDGRNHLYAVSLMPLKEDPDDPLVRAKKANGDDSENAGNRGNRGNANRAPARGGARQGDEERPAGQTEVKLIDVEIDLTNIDRRARRLTSGSDSVGSFFLGKDGSTIYFTRGGALHSIGVDGRNERQIAEGGFGGLTVTAEGDHIFYREGGGGRGGRGFGRGGGGGGEIARMPLRGGRGETITFNFNVKVDHRAEWEQVFEESWRVMKYRFYDEDMHGVDWAAMKQRYKPMLAYVGENQDLYDLCNEMIGELNASHTGVSGQPTRSMDRLYSTQNLGFEMAPDSRGRFYRVTHIYRDGPADKEWVDLSVGDYILSIDGREIRAGDNYYPILNHLLNDYVTLEVASHSSNGTPAQTRRARVRAIGSTNGLKYEEWVNKCREFVDEQSGGKVGYVHIRSMNQSSLRRFENEINQYWNKNGMIIDIRYNGGGNIDQQLIDILERRPYEYWNNRNGGRAWGRRPRQAIAGPQVMLINWRSASDSEVTPQAFRDLELGRIVGNPTYGAVIATGSYRLLNGGSIRTPGSLVVTYDPTQPHNYGVNLENFGVAPDVWVENSPRDEIVGYDRELKAAVDEALRMLAEDDWQWGEDE